MAMDWGKLLQTGLTLARNHSNDRQQGRQNAAQFQQGQNSQAIAQNNAQNNVMLQMAQMELLRKQFEQASRQTNARQAAQGGVMANVQDVSIQRPSHITNIPISGGMRPSAMGANGRAAGQAMSNQALASLLEGQSFMPLNPQAPVDVNAGMPKESALDKILGVAGGIGGAMQAYKQEQRGQQTQDLMQQLMQRYGQGTPQGVQGGTNASYADALRTIVNMGGVI